MNKELITKDTKIEFNDLSELSYKDNLQVTVRLYVNKLFVGRVKVEGDFIKNGDREYIQINNEDIYLDTIKKK